VSLPKTPFLRISRLGSSRGRAETAGIRASVTPGSGLQTQTRDQVWNLRGTLLLWLGSDSFVAMVQAADLRNRYDRTAPDWLNRSCNRGILRQ